MDDLSIRGELNSASTLVKTGQDQQSGSGFGAVLKDAMKEINQLQNNADQAISKVELENSGSIHEAMIALEKADISFRAMIQVRNKLIDAYQEVMRMQV
jgi:flagellar hook-basal body complex protein FliE